MSCREPNLVRKRCQDGPVCVQGPQGLPGLPCDMDWGVIVMQYIRTAIVGIATREGELLGRGFWVSNTVVVTAWSLVGRESSGVRVIIDVPLGSNVYQALPIDGVVVYAVPLLDVAFIVVNPLLLSNWRYTPRVLNLEGNPRAGDRVATTSAPGSFVTGFVCNPSVGTYGYIADVTTSLAPCVTTLVGAPIIHAATYGILGMVQYVSPYDVTSGGINAVLLATAIFWASSSCVLTRPIAQGAVTIPVLRDSLALGVLMNTESESLQVAVPLITEAVRPQLLAFPLGDAAAGAWVYSPVLISTYQYGPSPYAFRFGEGNEVSLHVPTVFGSYPLLSMNANYARANDMAWYKPITSDDDYGLTFPTGQEWVKVWGSSADVLAPYVSTVRVRVDPSDPAASSDDVDAIYVSKLGFVVFSTAAFPVADPVVSLAAESLSELIANPESVHAKRLLYAAPFACSTFANLGEDVHVSITTITTLDNLDNRFVVQWDVMSSACDPISFQVAVGYVPVLLDDDTAAVSAAAAASGEIRFQYAVTPGTWAGKPWLTATSLTSNPETSTLEVILVLSMPTPGDLIYFGTASLDDTLYMPQFKTVTRIGGATHYTAVCPARRTVSQAIYGTIAVIYANGSCSYSATAYVWQGFNTPIRVAQVNALTVGSTGVDDLALSTVLASIAPRATETVPTPVAVRLVEIFQPPGAAMDDTSLSALLQSATLFGSSSRSKATVISGQSILFDVNYEDAAVYNALLMTLPALSAGSYSSYVENNFTRVLLTITVPIPDAGVLVSGTDYLLFVVQLASTNSTFLDTQFSSVPSDHTCIIIYGNATSGYRYAFRSGYGGIVLPDETPLTPVVTSTGAYLRVSTTALSYTSDVVQRVNAIVIGRPPRAGNTPDNDPLLGKAVLVSGTVTVNAVDTKTALMQSAASVDTTTAYVITSQSGTARPLP